MTEDDAKKTICPVLTGPVIDPETGKTKLSTVKCMASGCAWWRWTGARNTTAFNRAVQKRIVERRDAQGGKLKPGDTKIVESEVLEAMRDEIMQHGECLAHKGVW